jgi:hypothetical protein
MYTTTKYFLALREGKGNMGEYRAGIFKHLWNPRIDSKESISPADVAWQAGTTALFPTRLLGPLIV